MTQPVVFCPYVGLASDRTLVRIGPDTAHRCFAQTPPGSPVQAHQATYCLGGGYATCPLFTTPQSPPLAAPPAPAPGPGVSRRWSVLAPVLVAAVLLIAVGIVYGRDLLAPPDAGLLVTMPPASPAAGAEIPTATHAASTPKPTLRAEHTQVVAQLFSTPTAEPGGQVVTLQVKPGLGGWWTSGNARANHLGDSFLYSGFFDGEAFIAAVSIDLRTLPRGAPVREATLRLTGLQADRLRPAAGGAWSIQLLPASVFGAFERVDFQALYNASPAVSLFPVLYPEQLAPRTTNSWSLELAGREWLARQIDEGAGSVIIRVSGPTGGDGTLFAWDSGTGPETTGQGPQLILSLGPVPATPPPLPTQVVAVASPTPGQCPDRSRAGPDGYSSSDRPLGPTHLCRFMIVTATPLPGNLATAPGSGLAPGSRRSSTYTPKPANTATAAANSAYATAVAVTTGTFTPVPTNAITPIVIMPTVVPQNPATAAAQMLASTAQARKNGTPTPLAYGVLVATPTPAALIVESTATPANLGTAVANAVNATAVALTTGTFTPVPRNAVTPTPPATGTPIPLLIPVTPPATATATPALPTHLPAQLAGKILFFSDRDGQTRLYALDPATGRPCG